MATLNQGLGVKAGGAGGGGGTNTNLGNTNLEADDVRTYKLSNGGSVTFNSFGGVNILQARNPDASIRIGPADTWYRMPLARGASGEILHNADAAGTVEMSSMFTTNGKFVMTFSGSDSAWAGDTNLFFKKGGGNMVESANLNLGMGNAIALEGWISDGALTPIQWTIQALWDEAEGSSISMKFVFCDYAGRTSFVGTGEEDLASGLENAGVFAESSGDVRANQTEGGSIVQGNFVTPVLINTGGVAIENAYFVLTLYFDNQVKIA